MGHLRSVSAGLVCAALSAVLAGCGGSSTNSHPADSPLEPEAISQEAEPTPELLDLRGACDRIASILPTVPQEAAGIGSTTIADIEQLMAESDDQADAALLPVLEPLKAVQHSMSSFKVTQTETKYVSVLGSLAAQCEQAGSTAW